MLLAATTYHVSNTNHHVIKDYFLREYLVIMWSSSQSHTSDHMNGISHHVTLHRASCDQGLLPRDLMAMPRDFDAIVSSLYHQYMMNMGFNVIRIAPPPRDHQ